jgi:hypothetical protein
VGVCLHASTCKYFCDDLYRKGTRHTLSSSEVRDNKAIDKSEISPAKRCFVTSHAFGVFGMHLTSN